jgi:hypothetical protein
MYGHVRLARLDERGVERAVEGDAAARPHQLVGEDARLGLVVEAAMRGILGRAEGRHDLVVGHPLHRSLRVHHLPFPPARRRVAPALDSAIPSAKSLPATRDPVPRRRGRGL